MIPNESYCRLEALPAGIWSSRRKLPPTRSCANWRRYCLSDVLTTSSPGTGLTLHQRGEAALGPNSIWATPMKPTGVSLSQTFQPSIRSLTVIRRRKAVSRVPSATFSGRK